MPPYSGIPYAQAPVYCFPGAELCMYALFVLCLMYAVKGGIRHVSYLLGGVAFGLILEYVNVMSNMGYTYGKFTVMFGRAPLDIPLCIGVGWGIIMYSARLFSDGLRLPLWSAAALDTLLAISIDLSMDTVAYRLHMWHWDWSGQGLNPLTAQWFGVPFANFFGWLMVVFFYSSASRLLERAALLRKKAQGIKLALVPLPAVLVSQVLLYVMLVYVDKALYDWFGIVSLHRFIAFLIVLIVMAVKGIRKSSIAQVEMPAVAWLVPVWFHCFFFAWLFIGGFYAESRWLVIVATLNILLGVSIHFAVLRRRSAMKPAAVQAV